MKPFAIALILALGCWAACGCGDDPSSPPDPSTFSGQWVLVSTVVAKSACPSGSLQSFSIEEVTITQDGAEVTLVFAEYSLSGTVTRGVLTAVGTLPSNESIHLQLTRSADILEGGADISGEACFEQRSLAGRPRLPDADFSGYWEFELVVVRGDGCLDIVDYQDCFRIIQSGNELLVVDDEAGNLTGTVTGDVGQLGRNTEAEVTSLVFYRDAATHRLVGTAVRYFPDAGCQSVLELVGLGRDQPCAEAVP